MNRFWNALFEFDKPSTPGDRVFLRLFEAFIVLGCIYLAWSWGGFMQRIGVVMMPLGVAQYVDVSFLHGPMAYVNATAISLLGMLGFVRRGRWAYGIAFLLLHLQFAGRYVLGEIPHSSNLMGMALLGFALAAIAYKNPHYRRRFAFGFTVFFVGLSYWTAGFCKLIGTGLHWPNGSHLWLWIGEKSVDMWAKTGALHLNPLQELAMSHIEVATAFLVVGLLTELSAALFWWPRFRLPVGLAIIGLHLGIYVVMNIMFAFSMVLLVLLTFPWARWIDAALAYANRTDELPSPRSVPAALGSRGTADDRAAHTADSSSATASRSKMPNR